MTTPLVGPIAEAVGVAKKVVIESLPSSFCGLYRKSTSCAPLEWTSFGRIWGGTSSPKFGNQYCPACLREFGHYQLRWTFAIYTCCLRHKSFLRDRCPRCGRVFRGADILFNSYIANAAKQLQHCTYCGGSVVNHEASEIADEKTIKVTCLVDSLIRKATCFDYFRVLHRLLEVMCRQSVLAKHMRLQFLPDSHQITSRHWTGLCDFGYLDVKSRAFMLQAPVGLFSDWPDYLVDVLRSTNHLHHLHHLLKRNPRPSWYQNAVRIASNKGPKS
jgi:TniQ